MKLYSFVKTYTLLSAFRKYKPFLGFLARFFVAYLVMAGLYQLYLSQYDVTRNQVDPITVAVGDQSAWVLRFFGSDAQSVPHPTEPCLKLLYNGKFVARVIEGCNAVSVMVLFAAFVLAFSGKLRTIIWFLFAGFFVIYVLNVLRISLLASALYHWPQYESFLHGVVFPFVIYSVVFILWIIWVNRYSYVKNLA